ncbi:hypothetical protein GW932_04390 [archaeon]|nr:hypothetical protein [archaeon]
MKTNKLILSGIIFFSLLINVSAFAVSSQYWEENPLTMTEGETKQIEIYLQNMAGTEDITAKGSITEGTGIARFIEEPTYLVKAGEKTKVIIEVKAPKGTEIKNYYIKVSFETTSEQGNFALKNSVERVIPIKVETESKKVISKTAFYLIIGLSAIIILLLVFLLLKKNKKKKKRK